VLETPELEYDVWVLYHDNAPAHDVIVTPEFLAKTSNNTEPPSIFTRFGPTHLLTVPEIDSHFERPVIVRCCQH